MKILYICNNISLPGNGICTSAQNFCAALREAGVDVRVLAGENKDPDGIQPDFRLKRFHFPIFQPIIDANGFSYASLDKKVIREAVEWADIIHCEEPLFVQRSAIKMAEKMGKSIVGTFHMYTQNLLSEIPLANSALMNKILLWAWKTRHYNHMSDIQCPTEVVKAHLERNGFKARLHVISNGINIPREPVVAKPYEGGPFRIILVGRFATIKRPEILLEAMKYSSHAREIQLTFAGTGVLEKKLRQHSYKLVKEGVLQYIPEIVFLDKAGLKELARNSYLVVHVASMEVEGLGCAEAIREGTVPVIAQDNKYIGTAGFALDDRSLFPYNDTRELARRIDWWIEHPQERNRMAQVYADTARNWSIENSTHKLIEMYEKITISQNTRRIL